MLIIPIYCNLFLTSGMAKQADRPAQSRNKKKKVQFIVSREFAGSQTMQEAFEQLIERQTCERFEEWQKRQAG